MDGHIEGHKEEKPHKIATDMSSRIIYLRPSFATFHHFINTPPSHHPDFTK